MKKQRNTSSPAKPQLLHFSCAMSGFHSGANQINSASSRSIKGFTLIELLVGVLIIGILAAVALPQYQKAVLKSRYSALMPIAKSMADSNEVYYMEHGSYANQPANLDVSGQKRYTDGTELDFGEDIDYAYVLASRPDVNNRYIVYQNHSENFPGEAHCEALDDDTQAISLCQSMGFTKDKGHILSDTYTTYTQEGAGNGMAPGVRLLASLASCAQANSKPGFSCTSTINDDGTATKEVCNTTEDNLQVCFKTVYNADGSYILRGTRGIAGQETSVDLYDADGNLQSSWNYRSSGNEYKYDTSGNLVQLSCKTRDINTHQCTEFNSPAWVSSYDSAGQPLTSRFCNQMNATTLQCETWGTRQVEYSYKNGNIYTSSNWSAYELSKPVYNNGLLTQYQSSSGYLRTLFYDENNNLIAERGAGIQSNTTVGGYIYIPNEDNTAYFKRKCANISNTGQCLHYSDDQNNEFLRGDPLSNILHLPGTTLYWN